MNGKTYLDAALEYSRRGWAVFPIRHGATEREHKRPAVRAWKPFQVTPPTPEQLRRMFSRRGLHGLAVVLGDVSGGLVCRDFDAPGLYESWRDRHPTLAAELPTVKTGDGYHVYITCPGTRLRLVDGGELRGKGGYTVVPPSMHPSGVQYRWLVPLGPTRPPEIDPIEVGLIGVERMPDASRDTGGATERTENTENTETTEPTEGTEESGGLLSSHETFSDEVEFAIAATQPATVGVRWRLVFQLARALKAVPELANAPMATLKPIVRKWHRMALARIGTKPFEETWVDFSKGWEAVLFPLGTEPMSDILERAKARPCPAAAEYEQPEARLLASICRELQSATGALPFYLSTRTAGRLLNVDHTTAWRWLYLLKTDRLIVEVEAGGRAHNARKATRFRYIGPT